MTDRTQTAARSAAHQRPAQRLGVWFHAARPKTLVASFCPVGLGGALAVLDGRVHGLALLASLVGATSIQMGTNFCNDYFDYVQGADTDQRKGPVRAVHAGLVSPRAMLAATALMFSITALCTLYLYGRAGWPYLVIGTAGIVFGVLYTASKYSLAYLGLGDPFVLVFFGPVAVAGTYYAQTLKWSPHAAWAGLTPGLLAVGLLVVNNLRDVDEDRAAGKMTLTVRCGVTFSRIQYTACVLLAALVPGILWWEGVASELWVASLVGIPGILVSWLVWTRQGTELGPCLGMTAGLLLLSTFLFCVGLFI